MDTSLFFVKHFITDKKGWDEWMNNWMVILGADDMNIDKG